MVVMMALNQIKLEKFINNLITYSDSNKVDNQYKKDIQVNNLKRYFENMYLIQPSILLVGEAPGYQGCAITGVPFTSEFILITHRDCDALNGCNALGNKKEPTATMVWGVLDEKEKEGKLFSKPLMWNIFPFHPIKAGDIHTNRKPSDEECVYGYNVLNDLLALFPTIEKIYAIGKAADKKLNGHPKYAGALRHPSNGGKKEFVEGINKIYS